MIINKALLHKYPWGRANWKKRTRFIGRMIPDGVKVLDLGGGMGNLAEYLHGCSYVSLDVEPWTNATVRANFNEGNYPDLSPSFDYVIAAGVIEYMNDPADFLRRITKYGRILILTYHTPSEAAMTKGRVVDMEPKQLGRLAESNGWEVSTIGRPTDYEYLFYCVRK